MPARTMDRILSAALTALLLVAFVSPVAAGAWGPRVGLTIDPDQVHAGMQFHAAQITPHVSFLPSFDLGAGDNAITVAGNMDFKYVFSQGPAHWRPYLGGGPGIFFVDVDNQASNTDVGINLMGGMQTPTQSGLFFGEMRLGLVDEADIKFTVGWMFR